MNPRSSSLSENPWTIRESDFPERASPAHKLRFLLNYAMLAPSIYNTQPWSFRVDGDAVELLADPNRALPSVDPTQRQLIISCGAALKNLLLALRHFRYDGPYKIFPDPAHTGLIARVHLGAPTLGLDTEQERLFMAIKKRRTYRGPFEPRPFAEANPIRAAAKEEGVIVRVFTEAVDKERLADLVRHGESMLSTDPWVRDDRREWTREDDHSNEGIPAFATAGHVSDESPERIALTTPDRLYDDLRNAPALLVLFTNRDHPVDWVQAGMGLARVLLKLTATGQAASFANQAIEVDDLRSRLADACGMQGLFPQIMLRAGTPSGLAYKTVPRRTVDDTIL